LELVCRHFLVAIISLQDKTRESLERLKKRTPDKPQTADSTSDIFKRIEAYKKQFQAQTGTILYFNNHPFMFIKLSCSLAHFYVER